MISIFLKRSVPIPFPYFYVSVQLLICWLTLIPCSGKAESLVGAEYEVKMGFIYNFATFITWPQGSFSSPEEPIFLCFASDHPAANVLFQLDDQTIQGRKVKVQKIETQIGNQKCHILFFGTDNKPFIQQALVAVRGQHTLTIGEVTGFARMGGIINFFNLQNKLRFEVNIDAAKRENLKLSAQILQSAQRIIRETEQDRQAQAAAIANQPPKPDQNAPESEQPPKSNQSEPDQKAVESKPPSVSDQNKPDQNAPESEKTLKPDQNAPESEKTLKPDRKAEDDKKPLLSPPPDDGTQNGKETQ